MVVNLDPELLKQVQEQKQVVETESVNRTPPKDAKYLSEHNQSVDQETRAHRVDTFRSGAPAKGQSGQTPQKLTLKNLAPKEITPPREDEYSTQPKTEAQQEAAAGGPQGAEAQDAATNDLLRGVKEGDRTMLNTKEFVYYGYYHRIRERLEKAWNSKLRATLENDMVAGRHLAADHEYVTSIVVVLDRHGKIVAVQILGASGARDLDQAAVDAFNQAGPFPDPPTGLVGKDGTIKIRWDFVLQS